MSSIDELLERYRSFTKKECIHIKTYEQVPTYVWESKFGGLPYLPHDAQSPTTQDGKQLHFVAQYHLDVLPKNKVGLPSKGMLQFWVLMDDVYGIDNNNHALNDKHRVIYYETVDKTVTREDVEKKYRHPDDEYFNPIIKELSISFEIGENYMSFGDRNFDNVLQQLGVDLEQLSDEEQNKFWLTVNIEGHFIGGHPTHIQQDIRDTRLSEMINPSQMDYSKYDILLLQIDSELNEACTKDIILWGVCGNAHFYITKDDLAQCDFSKVMYDWNCY